MTTTKNNEHKKLNFSSEREQSQACLNSAEHEKNQGRKVLNVPNLRFPEFQGEWITYKIKDVLSIGNGRDYKCLNNGEIPVFGTGGYITSVDECLYDGETTFIGRKGSINKPFYYNGKFWTVDTLFYTHSFNGITPKFTYCLFQTINWLKYNEASGVPSLSKDTIEKIKINIPGLEEQNKIAKLMFALDERITTQNKIIDKLQSLIKGIADKLFQTARTTKPLLEFAPNITSGTDKSGSGTIPLYGSTGIIGTVKNASQKGNIVLVARVGTIGTVQYVNEPCGVSDNALIVEAGEMTKYIYHFLKTYNFTRITSGTTQPLITASSLKKAAIPTYDIESQTRIVLCLNGLEKKLDMAKQYLSDIAVMKRYLLRQMFI